jgi:hypothetical protein
MIFKGRRKRGKAARLHPLAEDAASTTQLFNGAHRRAAPGERRAAPPLPDPPNVDDLGAPRLRYEWRSATGEVLVVEAGLPETPTTAPSVSLRSVPLRETEGLYLRR